VVVLPITVIASITINPNTPDNLTDGVLLQVVAMIGHGRSYALNTCSSIHYVLNVRRLAGFGL